MTPLHTTTDSIKFFKLSDLTSKEQSVTGEHVLPPGALARVLDGVGLGDHEAGLGVDAGQHRVLGPGDAVLAGRPEIRKINILSVLAKNRKLNT